MTEHCYNISQCQSAFTKCLIVLWSQEIVWISVSAKVFNLLINLLSIISALFEISKIYEIWYINIFILLMNIIQQCYLNINRIQLSMIALNFIHDFLTTHEEFSIYLDVKWIQFSKHSDYLFILCSILHLDIFIF